MSESARRTPLEDDARDSGIPTPQPQPLSPISPPQSPIRTLLGAQQTVGRMKAVADVVRTCSFRHGRLEKTDRDIVASIHQVIPKIDLLRQHRRNALGAHEQKLLRRQHRHRTLTNADRQNFLRHEDDRAKTEQVRGMHHLVEGLNASSRSQIQSHMMDQRRLRAISERRIILH